MRWRGLRTAILAAAYALTCTGMLAALPAAPAAAATPVISISPVNGTFYTNPCDSGVICLGSPAAVLSGPQAFPVIDFNPPSGAVPCSPLVSVNTSTQPFTDVVANPDGSCTLIQVNNGNGPSPGPGSTSYAAFQAVFTGTFTVTGGATQVTFNMFSDDGWLLGIGPDSNGQQPTYVSGANSFDVSPAPTTSFAKGYLLVGAENHRSHVHSDNLTVSFPEAGTYPFEADYDECCGLPESFSMNANGGVITHSSNLGLTPQTQSQTVNGSATVTAQLFNANPLGTQITFTLTGANGPQTKTVGAASDGTATFTYTGTHAGQDTITASATVGGQTLTSTLPATVTWNPVSTSMTLTSSDNPSYAGQQVTYTATVTAASTAAGAPAGSVAFTDNHTAISGCGDVPLSSTSPYTASCAVTYAAPGSHPIAAAFTPSSTDFTGSQGNRTQTVEQAATTLTLTSTAAPLQMCGGDRDGDDPGCAPGVKGPKEGPGKPGGPGDRDDHGPGPKEGPGVPPAPPGLPDLHGLGGLFGGPHGTVFDRVYVPSGTDVSVPGQSVTFTATVSVQAPGAGTPTGTVTFTDTTAGGATTTLGTATLTTTGGVTSASLTTAALPPGAQTITATYGGDTNFQGSNASLTQSVEYIFVGLLPPFGGRGGVDPNRTIPVSFILLDAGGHPVTTATATLEVNGRPAVPQGHANVGDAFRLHGIRYQYDLKLRDQGVSSGTATLTVLTSDGNTHTFTLTVRAAPKLRPGGVEGPH